MYVSEMHNMIKSFYHALDIDVWFNGVIIEERIKFNKSVPLIKVIDFGSQFYVSPERQGWHKEHKL